MLICENDIAFVMKKKWAILTCLQGFSGPLCNALIGWQDYGLGCICIIYALLHTLVIKYTICKGISKS